MGKRHVTSSGFYDVFTFVCFYMFLQGLNECSCLIGPGVDINRLQQSVDLCIPAFVICNNFYLLTQYSSFYSQLHNNAKTLFAFCLILWSWLLILIFGLS